MFNYSILKLQIRRWLKKPAGYLNDLTNGRLHPNHLTIIGLLLHLPCALLLANGYLIVGACLLLIVSLLDALDGTLARLQNKTSDFGAWLDAGSDRLSETLIGFGLTYYLVQIEAGAAAVSLCLVFFCGSQVISYVKAKAEALLANRSQPGLSDLNTRFQAGFLGYEIRVLGLVLVILTQFWFLGFLLLCFATLITIGQRGYLCYKVLSVADPQPTPAPLKPSEPPTSSRQT